MKKRLLVITVTVLIFHFLIAASCKKETTPVSEPQLETGTISDSEGNTYQTIKIGNQIWMAENLKAKHTTDGTEVVEAYIYNNSESNLAEYGRLYTWEAAKRPYITGWHLPSEAEWNILESTLGADAGAKLKVGGNSGFNAKLGGYRAYTGEFVGLNSQGSFWTSSVYTIDHSFVRSLFSSNNTLEHAGSGNIAGNSVRLIKD